MKTSLRTVMTCVLVAATAPMVGFAADTPEEAANKKLVLDYYRDIEATVGAGKVSELPKVDAKYRDPGYIQHGVGGQGGRGMQAGGGAAPAGGPPPQGGAGAAPAGGPPPQGGAGVPPRMGSPRLISIMADGDMVNQVTMRSMPGPDGKTNDTIIFNLFRVKNGKLIEHWDAFGVPSTPTPNSSTPK